MQAQDDIGQIIGAVVHDHIGNKSYDVYAKEVGFRLLSPLLDKCCRASACPQYLCDIIQ